MLGLAFIRKARNLTQQELAELCDTDRSCISKWESGLAAPRADKLTKIAKALGCSVDDLLKQPTADKE